MNDDLNNKFVFIKPFAVFIISCLFLFSIKYNVQANINKNSNINIDDDIKKLNQIVKDTVAEGVIIYDLKNDKILSSKNIDTSYSLASLTKIITANLAYEKDKTLLNDIRYMLKTSDNRIAKKISNTFGSTTDEQLNYINKKTEKYNLIFLNATGLDILDNQNENRFAGGSGKPKDFIDFTKDYYTKYPEIFDQTIRSDNNTNIIVNNLSFLSGGKTGFTLLSGGNLFVSIQKGLGRDIFILVLNSTEENRFVDVQNIANFLLQSNI